MAPTLYRDTGYTLTHLIEDIKHGQHRASGHPAAVRVVGGEGARPVRLDVPGLPRRHAHVLGDRRRRRDAAGRRRRVRQVPKLLIVDGQQRLTSLFAVLTGQRMLTKDFEERRIRIAFRPSDETFEVTDAAIERDPEFIPDITALWGKLRIPITADSFDG